MEHWNVSQGQIGGGPDLPMDGEMEDVLREAGASSNATQIQDVRRPKGKRSKDQVQPCDRSSIGFLVGMLHSPLLLRNPTTLNPAR